MRPPKRLTARQRLEVERFAYLTDIGPLFDMRPKHHGQHSWTCRKCNTVREHQEIRKSELAELRNPWDVKPSRFAA